MESTVQRTIRPYVRRLRRIIIFLLIVIILLDLMVAIANAGRVGVRLGPTYVTRNVRSMHELRWTKLTRQGWDISCGAAALSTLLTFHHQRPFSEMAITLSLLKNSDPERVKKRGGFSLYDLKRFVRAVELEGVGYAEVQLEDLDYFDLPAILPLKTAGQAHFVVFKKRLGDQVLIGDPALGNTYLSVARFEKLWSSRVAFYVVNLEEKRQLQRQEKALINNSLAPTRIEITAPDSGYVSRVLGRIPTIPVVRRGAGLP